MTWVELPLIVSPLPSIIWRGGRGPGPQGQLWRQMKNEMVIKCEMEVVQACRWGEIEEGKASGLESGWNAVALRELWRHSVAIVSPVTDLNKARLIYFKTLITCSGPRRCCSIKNEKLLTLLGILQTCPVQRENQQLNSMSELTALPNQWFSPKPLNQHYDSERNSQQGVQQCTTWWDAL